MRIRLATAVLALCAALSGCGGDRTGADAAGDASPVLVFAASDLQTALEEIRSRYEEESGRDVTLVFGSTGNFTTQILNGAPADLFFAANESFLDRLVAAGLVRDETRRVYARGRLALVWRAAVRPLAAVADLARPGLETAAIANPEHAPYGVAAREALQAAGVWERVRPRLVYGENVAQTHQLVSTGNADAGIVALSLVLGAEPRPHVVVPESQHAPLRQSAAVLRGSERPEEALRFLEFVSSPEGQEILRRYGFGPPSP